MSELHALSREGIDGQVLDDLVVASESDDGVRVVETLGDTILALGEDGHGGPLAVGTVDEVVDVVDGGTSGRGGRRGTTSGDDGGSALLDGGDEGGLNPLLVVDDLSGGLAVDEGMSDGRVLSGRVVTPDGEVLNGSDGGSGLEGELSQTARVVQTSHGREVLGRDGGSVASSDHAVSVGRVSDDESLNSLLGSLVESLSLSREDLSVGEQQITTLHSLGTRTSSNQQSIVDISEGLLGVLVGGDLTEEGESAVLQLHDDSLQSAHGLRKLEQLQLNGDVGTQKLTRSNAEQESIADGSGGSSDGNLHGLNVGGRGNAGLLQSSGEVVQELAVGRRSRSRGSDELLVRKENKKRRKIERKKKYFDGQDEEGGSAF